MSNSTICSGGRLGNQIIRNTACSLLAEKYNLQFLYGYKEQMIQLGIPLFYDGKNYYNDTVNIKDDDFPRFLLREDLGKNNIYAMNNYYQTAESANIYRDFYHSDSVKQSIIHSNPYKDRYNNNQDLYVHIRLTDAERFCPTFEYYDMVLQKIKFEHGYISTDNFNHEICKKIIEKYGLKPIHMDEVQTIQFASTCKYVVLTNGTFGWFIGLIAWYSEIYYPNLELREKYHGDIYIYPDWNMIQYE